MGARGKTAHEVSSLLGDPRKVDQELRRFRKSSQRLSERQSRLIEQYPQEWVAGFDGKVVAHARTFTGLLTRVDKKKLPRGQVIVRYIDTTQRTMIL